MLKSKMINFRVTEEENILIEKEASKTSSSKTDYCKKLILRHEVVNITPYQTIEKLLDLWQEMEKLKIRSDILDKLKKIILECK